MITVKNVSKIYRVAQKEEGLKNAFKGLFRRRYKEIEAVADVSFEILDSEIVGLIGLNRAGKTTILKMLSGLIKPSSGTSVVNGFDPWKKENDFLRTISFLMGNKSQLSWDIPAVDSFRLEAALYDIANDTFEKTLANLSSLLHVTELLTTPVRKLSLGERMKMEFILTLLHRPKIVLLDEPTLGLDIISQKNIRNFLRDYRDREHAIIIITSHNMNDIDDICDRVITLNKGSILYDGAVGALKRKYDNYSIVKLIFDNSTILENLTVALKDLPFEMKNQSINKVRVKVQNTAIDLIKTKVMKIEGVREFSIEPLSFESILEIMLNEEQ